jgi:hypothetical protein
MSRSFLDGRLILCSVSDEFYAFAQLSASQVPDSTIQSRQFSVIMDGDTQQIGVGRLAVALHSQQKVVRSFKPRGGVRPKDMGWTQNQCSQSLTCFLY